MTEQAIRTALLEQLRTRLPDKKQFVQQLGKLLGITRESVYRRMRGEVALSLEEAVKIARMFDISLDAVIHSPAGGACQMKLLNEQAVSSAKDVVLTQYVETLHRLTAQFGSQVWYSCHSLPLTFLFGYEALSRFSRFKCAYRDGCLESGGLSGAAVPPEVRKMQSEIVTASRRIGHSSYLFDAHLFRAVVREIQFFGEIGLLSAEDRQTLKTELLQMLDEMEALAVGGRFGNGRSLSFFVSSLPIDNNYTCFKAPGFRQCMIEVFLSGGLFSYDARPYTLVRDWMQSLIKTSTLISECGELQRSRFFKRQREMVDGL